MIATVAVILAVSIILYAVLAGADFGAGILECFLRKEHREADRELITHALGPVWEANHIWLILALVILFTAFPEAYSTISTVFHIPLTLMLLGIVLRGCAFTFRHYDAVKDRSQNLYSTVFMVSSILTPMAQGLIAGGATSGIARPGLSFSETYIAPWFNPFCFTVGAFLCALYAFLAAVYLVGETADTAQKRRFGRFALASNTLLVVFGALVVFVAARGGHELAVFFAIDTFIRLWILAAAVLLLPLWIYIYSPNSLVSRVSAAGIVVFVLLGWIQFQFPYFIHGTEIDLFRSAAPPATLRNLLYALGCGALLVFPALYFLFRTFKLGEHGASGRSD